jgi:predicted RNA-binding protein with TRAM domain
LSYINRGSVGSNYPRDKTESEETQNQFGRSGDERGSDRGRRQMKVQRPVELGKEYDVEIIEKSRRTDGIAKIEGFVIFVRDAKVGEKIKIKIESLSYNFAIGSRVEMPAAQSQPTN